MNLIQNLIRVGKVSSINNEEGSVRVTFADRDHLVSGELPVLTPGGWGNGNVMPRVGDNVVCVFLGNGQQAGFCLGTYFTKMAPPSGTLEQNGVWFEDGSHVFYDRTTRTLNIKAASGVRIEGNLTVTGIITSGGEEHG